MPSLLKKVKSRLFIAARRRTLGMLDGEYGSVFKGRGLDFDELRSYVPGDDVRDIDWKATARHGSPLIRRYISIRRQTVLLVADTGRNMAAASKDGNAKREAALDALGLIGFLALRHGDGVALVHGDAEKTYYFPPRTGEEHLERLLRTIHDAAGRESPRSDLSCQLRFTLRNFRQRMLVFVVADEFLPDAETESLLRRLQARHEILWLTVRDAALAVEAHAEPAPSPGGFKTVDISDGTYLPDAPASRPSVRRAYAEAMKEREGIRREFYRRLGVTEGVTGGDDVVPALFRLLELHRMSRAHAG